MGLPSNVSVKYTEEEAGYVYVRPVVRQTFRLEELLDMVLSVAGKDPARVQQILRSGTVVYHFYRYWWTGFEAGEEELAGVLARFPNADPSRPFRREDCGAVVLEGAGQPPSYSVEVDRRAAHRRIFRSGSFWSSLMGLAETSSPVYRGYSYSRRADIYELDLSSAQAEQVKRAAGRAPRRLCARLERLPEAADIIFICPRRDAIARGSSP